MQLSLDCHVWVSACPFCDESARRWPEPLLRLQVQHVSVLRAGGRSRGGYNEAIFELILSIEFGSLAIDFGPVLLWPLQLWPPLRSAQCMPYVAYLMYVSCVRSLSLSLSPSISIAIAKAEATSASTSTCIIMISLSLSLSLSLSCCLSLYTRTYMTCVRELGELSAGTHHNDELRREGRHDRGARDGEPFSCTS